MSKPIVLWLAVVALLGSATPGSLHAQEPAAATIDVVVVDAKGQPVAGLTADAFRATLGDRPRRVTAAEYVGTASGAGRGRAVYLVIDQASVFAGAERGLTDVAAALIDRFGPDDRLALVALPEGPRVALTADVSEIETALTKIGGRRSPELTNFNMGVGEALAIAEGDTFALTAVADRECRGFASGPPPRDAGLGSATPVIANPRAECVRRIARNVELMVDQARRASAPIFQGLLDLLTSLRDVSGPKAVVLVTSGLAVVRGEGAFDEVAIRAAAAGTTLHALIAEVPPGTTGPRLVPANPSNDRRSLGRRLDELTAAAIGISQIASARSDEAFDRLAAEMSGFYRLTVETEAGDGAPRGDRGRERFRVAVGTRGATVRARPFLLTPALRTRVAATPDDRLAEALRDGAPRAELGLRVAAYLLLAADKTPAVLVAGDVELPAAACAPRSTVTLRYALFDDRRQPISTGAIAPSTTGDAARNRVAFVGTLDGLSPGRYTLRVAATDGGGRVGSAEAPVEVRAADLGGLVSGGVIFGREGQQGTIVPGPDALTVDETIALQLDLVGPAAGQTTVRFAFVPGGASSPLTTLVASVSAADDPRLRRATAVLRPRLLPAGVYAVHAEVATGGRVLGRLTRPLTLRAPTVAATPTTAGATVGLAGPLLEQVWALTPRFSRETVLGGELLTSALAALGARATTPAARAAIERARTGPVARPDEALRRADPLTAAFLDGIALLTAAELEPAAGQFREALRSASDFYPAAIYLGACYAAGGKDREAAGAWQTALIEERDDAALHALILDALLRLRDVSGAADVLDEVRTRWPTAPGFAERRVVADLAAGRLAEALAGLDGLPDATADLLFVVLNALYEAHVGNRPLASTDEDRARARVYADRYLKAGGPNRALVERWLNEMGQPR